MASYTIELKEVLELYASGQADNLRDRIDIGRKHLFDFTYPFYDSTYKDEFETHFVRHFFTREIGFETEGLFKFYLETWMNIHMPFYNQLFESEQIKFDPLVNSYMQETASNTKDTTLTGSKNSTQSGTSTSSNTGSTTQDVNGSLTEDNFDRQLVSNNPDMRLALTANDGQGVIEYASNIEENNENNSKTSSSHETGSTTQNATVNGSGTVNDTLSSENKETETNTVTKTGKVGDVTYSKMLNEYRSSLMRVEKMLFEEMEKNLFMLVY